MPLVKIEIINGKSAEYKKTLLDVVHNSLVTAIGIEAWDRFQRLYELDDGCFEANGKSDKFTMIEITMFQGRTKEQKAALYREIVRSLGEELSIVPADVFITINEPPDENWGLAGKQGGADV